jgi:hypothetical protein
MTLAVQAYWVYKLELGLDNYQYGYRGFAATFVGY